MMKAGSSESVSVGRWRRRPGTPGAYFIIHNTEHGDALGDLLLL